MAKRRRLQNQSKRFFLKKRRVAGGDRESKNFYPLREERRPSPMQPDYLRATDIVDYDHPAVAAKARELASAHTTDAAIAEACFRFVRDAIRHSSDHQLNPVTSRASDVLAHATGYCFAKSHLLAALLRANAIQAGFCYQRLSFDDTGPPFVLHGFNAVRLNGHGWYRIDPRGNKPGVTTEFTPPIEALAYTPKLPGEADLPEIWPDPLPAVVHALTRATTWQDALENLPDIQLFNPKSRPD
jgi:transglutaminase-like putative cysteine protease